MYTYVYVYRTTGFIEKHIYISDIIYQYIPFTDIYQLLTY